MRVTGVLIGGCVLSSVFLAQNGCVSTLDLDTYTRISLKNPLSIVREDEVVAIPLSVIRSRYNAFYEKDFSVHALPTKFDSKGDPMLAADPPPELPAQLADRDLDGEFDTLLVSMDFHAGQTRYIAVASPRFSVLAERPRKEVHSGLWQRSTLRYEGARMIGEGDFSPVDAAVLPPGRVAGDGLFFGDGIVFETDRLAYRLTFDRRLAVDVIGKRSPQLALPSLAEVSEPLFSDASPVTSLLGEPVRFGGGSLAMHSQERILPLDSFTSVQFRHVADGPVAAEVELLIAGCRLGNKSFDVKWQISVHRGQRYLAHRVSVSRIGHNLAFAVNDGGAVRKQLPSTRLGWMRGMSFGPENVETEVGGSLGLGVMALGRQSTGYADDLDVIAIKFDPMLRDFQWYSFAAWDREPGVAIGTLEQFERYIEETATRINNPILVKNLDYPGT